MNIITYLKLLRVSNYIKNVFIFAPLFFVLQFEQGLLLNTLICFVLFSFLASSIYILNDIFDVESDKKHPVKKSRPIAAGAISIKRALLISISLLLISIVGIAILNMATLKYFWVYLLLNLAYNLFLKRIPIIDVIVLGIGFVVRILVGSSISEIPASRWILVMTFLLSLFLGFSKRRADLLFVDKEASQRLNLKLYSKRGINKFLIVLGIVISISYFFYTVSPQVEQRWGSHLVFLTTVWVVFGMFRYFQIIFLKKVYYTPTSVVTKDLTLQLIIVSWVATFFLIYYV